jgi:hypothetical protein
MAIFVVANANANAVEFRGTNLPVYYNAVLEARVNTLDNNRVDVINKVQSVHQQKLVYEFFGVSFSEYLDADGNQFANAQDAADYITAECNKIVGEGAKTVGVTNTLGFSIDVSGETILISDGNAFPINSLSASTSSNGLIQITQRGGTAIYYSDLYLDKAYINNTLVTQSETIAVNELNALFTSSALGSGGFTSTPTAAIDGGSGITINPGDEWTSLTGNVGGADNANPGTHGAHFWTTETIGEAGEYFTVTVSGGESEFAVGLYDAGSDSTHLAELQAANGTADDGFWYGICWHPSSDGPLVTVGDYNANVYGTGWNGTRAFRNSSEYTDWNSGDEVLLRVGVTTSPNGFAGVWYWDVSEEEWVLVGRSATPLSNGEYGLAFKALDSLARVDVTGGNAPQVFQIDSSGVDLTYYWIESPDGNYSYPIFTSAAEANAYDSANGGSGTNHAHTYVDDSVNGRVWYMPDNGSTMGASSAPSSTTIVWNEVQTQDDNLFVPSAFTATTYTVNESSSVNIEVSPSNATYTSTLSNAPTGLSLNGRYLQGNAPEVAGTSGQNASDSYDITVTRTNSFGSSTGTLTLVVTNTSSAITPSNYTVQAGGVTTSSATGSAGIISALEFAVLDTTFTFGSGDEVSWAHQDDLYIGVADSGADKTTDLITSYAGKWDLLAPIVGSTPTFGSISTPPIGWDDNTTLATITGNPISQANTWKMVHTGTTIELYLNNNLYRTSSATNYGDVTITVATPAALTSPTELPALTHVDNSPTPVSGFTHVAGTTNLVDSDTLDDGSAVSLDDTLTAGRRLTISAAWITSYVLPALTASGDEVWIGASASGTGTTSDFDVAIRMRYNPSFLSDYTYEVIGSTTQSNALFQNSTAFAIEMSSSTVLAAIGTVGTNYINNQTSVADGGFAASSISVSGTTSTSPVTISIVTVNTQMDIATSGLNEIDIPPAPTSGFTWVNTSTALIDSTTLDDGSVVSYDTTLSPGKRLIIPQSWVEANVLPYIDDANDTAVIVGVATNNPDWTTVSYSDFIVSIEWRTVTSIVGGVATAEQQVTLVGESSNVLTINTFADAVYDYAIELDYYDQSSTTDMSLLSTTSGITTKVSAPLGGFSGGNDRVETDTDFVGTIPATVYIGTIGTDMSLTSSGLSIIDIPLPSNYIVIAETSEGVYTFNGSSTMPTLAAGSTYRFVTSSSTLESADVLSFVLDGTTTAYTTGVTTSGTPGTNGAYVEFAVPSDVPPIDWKIGTTTGNAATSGSTYVVSITGITLEGPSANQTGTNVMDQYDHGWISLSEQLSAGERLVLDNTFFADFMAEVVDTTTIFAIGLKGDNWTNTKEVNNAQAANSGEFFKGDAYIVGVSNNQGTGMEFKVIVGSSTGNGMGTIPSLYGTISAFLEITSDGNNIRLGFGRNGDFGISQGDESTVAYDDWSAYKQSTGNQGYGITAQDVVMSFWSFDSGPIDGAEIDWTNLSEVSVPTGSSTNWTKALDFSGGNEHAKQASASSTTSPIRMGDSGTLVSAPTTAGNTASGSSARPWATAVVFQYDGNASNQHIWNQGEGTGSTDDNIYLRLDSSGNLYFGWGRTGALNECKIAYLGTGTNTSHWHGFYIAHTGERLSGANATAANLADCFSIRWFTTNYSGGTWGSFGTEYSTEANWTAGSTGGRMDRTVAGDFTVGGRGSNRNFHGKVAGMVVTTLRTGQPMPNATEIEQMISDPVGWVNDYKVGASFRQAHQSSDTSGFQLDVDSCARATQVWLMGDGASDAYSTIRNQVRTADTTSTSLSMQSMVSNDIVNVSITGL